MNYIFPKAAHIVHTKHLQSPAKGTTHCTEIQNTTTMRSNLVEEYSESRLALEVTQVILNHLSTFKSASRGFFDIYHFTRATWIFDLTIRFHAKHLLLFWSFCAGMCLTDTNPAQQTQKPSFPAFMCFLTSLMLNWRTEQNLNTANSWRIAH